MRQALSISVHISDKRCKACGICVELCPEGVLVEPPPHFKAEVANIAACTGCGICQLVCPDWAISVEGTSYGR